MTFRRALLVGINDYPGMPLRGCVNDVKQMQALLGQHFDFADDEVQVLLDEDATAKGIKAGLAWLAEGDGSTDAVRVFHFSGHGTHKADENGDEPDGRDECLVPVDYRTAGHLTDDVLKTYYDRFPPEGNLSLVMDCCHSGSINRGPDTMRFRFLPVPYEERERMDAAARQYAADRKAFIVDEVRRLRSVAAADDDLEALVAGLVDDFDRRRFGDDKNREGNVIMAACRDDQQAADAHIGGDYHGAFTFYLNEAIQKGGARITYRDLAQAATDGLSQGSYGQLPQLGYKGDHDTRLIFRPFA